MSALAPPLDHFIFPVRDFDIVALAWQRLGFRIMEPMKHIELGSWNRIVQFSNTYLEVFSRFEGAIPAIQNAFLPIIQQREGLAFIGFNCREIDIERKRVRQFDVEVGPTNNARRIVRLPDGQELETASSSASARLDGYPLMSLFFSEHHRVEAIWQDYYMAHENGVMQVSAVVWASSFSDAERGYFRAMLGVDPIEERPGSVRYETRRGESLIILSNDQVAQRYGEQAPAIDTVFQSRPIALEFKVKSLPVTTGVLQRNNVKHSVAADGSICVPESQTHGVVLRFHA